jgi:ADP-ribose pyrophosphatase YjhB (NUDIX family)
MKNYIMELREKVGSMPVILAGANIIVVNKKNEILLQKRSDSKKWSLPGGMMEIGESFEDVARRELFEETNLKCNTLEFLKTFSGERLYHKYPNGDEIYAVLAVFKVTKFTGELKINDKESLDLKFFAESDFSKLELEKTTKIILDETK